MGSGGRWVGLREFEMSHFVLGCAVGRVAEDLALGFLSGLEVRCREWHSRRDPVLFGVCEELMGVGCALERAAGDLVLGLLSRLEVRWRELHSRRDLGLSGVCGELMGVSADAPGPFGFDVLGDSLWCFVGRVG